jgi:SAM-dependent methyltransferase
MPAAPWILPAGKLTGITSPEDIPASLQAPTIDMPIDTYCCPVCKNSLSAAPAELTCTSCGRVFPILNDIPDFFIIESEQEAIDEANQIWQDQRVAQARDTIYRLSTRELRGMNYCMEEIARRTGAGVRVLDAGLGTGHFTRWLAELAAPGTEIYAFDCSWPILKTAQVNLSEIQATNVCQSQDGLLVSTTATAGRVARSVGVIETSGSLLNQQDHAFNQDNKHMGSVTLFRANARGRLPFPDQWFDILFLRLAPLGPHGVPNVTAGYQLLKPGGWYFEAGWERQAYQGTWTGWAIQHGFEHAEHHAWQYPRKVTEEEERARQVEQAAFPADSKTEHPIYAGNVKMTIENLLIAQKP